MPSLQAIKVPDAADAAERSDIAEIRRYTVKTHSVVMIIGKSMVAATLCVSQSAIG